MRSVTVNAGKKYDILIGSGLLDKAGELIREVSRAAAVTLVSDDNVFSLYGEKVTASLKACGFRVITYVFPHGEESKNLTVWGGLLEKMCGEGMTRTDIIVALGGGVTGDLAGFAAASYQRGIDFVQLPTSLLAAVDSSVGGKTGVDLKAGKNQVGAFHQPIRVICDTDALSTLPDAEYRNGCAEIIKYAMLEGEELFGLISSVPVKDNYADVIEHCVTIKKRFVEEDEFDRGLRMLLNLGHTFGHAVEASSSFEIAHGAAVAMGMGTVTRAAAAKGLCGDDVKIRLEALLVAYGLSSEIDYPVDVLVKAAGTDKKNSAGRMRLIVPYAIGDCRVVNTDAEGFAGWLKAGGVK